MEESIPRIFLTSILLLFFIYPLQGQTWEVYDLQGKLKSLAIYDQVDVVSETVIFGRKESSLSMLSRELIPLVNLEGDEVFQYLAPWIIVKGPHGLGAYHEYGIQAFPLEYDEIETYFNFLLGRKGNNYWLYSKGDGKTTALGTWDSCRFSKKGLVIGQKDGMFFLPLSQEPERQYELIEENEGSYLLAKESTGFGILNFEGNYVMEPILSQLEHTKGDYFYGFDEKQYLLIKGNIFKTDVSYNSFQKITKEGDLLLEYIHGKLRRIMEEGGILLDAVGMESVRAINSNFYNVRFREGTTGLLGRKGWEVLPSAVAEWINPGNEGFFPAGKGGKTGFINSSGKWVIEPQFDEVSNFQEKIATFRIASTWGIIGMDGSIISDAKWDEIKDFYNEIAVAKANNKFFLLDKKGEAINLEGFGQVYRLNEGYFLVEKEGKKGLLDSSGKEILPIIFENIQVEKSDFFIVTKDGLTGVLNGKGDAIFPIYYQEIVADWAGNQIFAKELYHPVIIQAVEETSTNKPKKGA